MATLDNYKKSEGCRLNSLNIRLPFEHLFLFMRTTIYFPLGAVRLKREGWREGGGKGSCSAILGIQRGKEGGGKEGGVATLLFS